MKTKLALLLLISFNASAQHYMVFPSPPAPRPVYSPFYRQSYVQVPEVQYIQQPVQPQVQYIPQQPQTQSQTIVINQYSMPAPTTQSVPPVVNTPPAQPKVDKVEPENTTRDNFIKECQRYGFDKDRCEGIWDDKPVPYKKKEPESKVENVEVLHKMKWKKTA